MATISLGASKTITKKAAEVVTTSEVTLNRVIDNRDAKRVVAFVNELNYPIILWEGAEYDTIGQWTDAQADAKLIEKINALS